MIYSDIASHHIHFSVFPVRPVLSLFLFAVNKSDFWLQGNDCWMIAVKKNECSWKKWPNSSEGITVSQHTCRKVKCGFVGFGCLGFSMANSIDKRALSASIFMHLYHGEFWHYCSQAFLTLPSKAAKSNPDQEWHQGQLLESSSFSKFCC